MDFEYILLDFIRNTFSNGVMDTAMRSVSFLADIGWIWIVFAVLCLFFPKTRKIGITVALALIFSLIFCNLTLKPLIDRIRPYELREGIALIITAPTDASFPSGHTSISFAGAAAIFAHNKKWGIWALALAALIAFSRLYLYVHFPTDVLGGIVIGSACGVLAYYVSKWLFTKIKI